MNLKLTSFIYTLVMLLVCSCETLDINPKNNPNALAPNAIEPDLLLNSVQLGMANVFNELSNEGSELTRMTHMFGPLYNNAYTPENLDGEWTSFYAGLLADVEALIPAATEKELFTHVAIAKIAKAYAYTTLVDFFGDVPFAEAIKGNEGNTNPKRDASADIYKACEVLLDEALADFDKTSILPGNDLFFGGNTTDNVAKWRKLINTLKFRMYVQVSASSTDPFGGAVAKAQALANDASLISSEADDFAFTYGTNLANPDSRHPSYRGDYDNGASVYQSIGYMHRFTAAFAGANLDDPRLRYYFYRQETTNTTDVNEKRCVTQDKPSHFAASDVFCQLTGPGVGYWGRDHGDAAGIPPDGLLRTIYGVYPVGGKFDYSQDTRGRQGSGAGGYGIAPIMLSSFVDFLRAEAAITMGTGEDARALFEKGMRASIAKTISFGTRDVDYNKVLLNEIDDPNTKEDDGPDTSPKQKYEPSTTAINNYVNALLAGYDNPASLGYTNPLDVVVSEFYKAAYGNGIDIYNAFRRTGFPSRLQPTLIEGSGENGALMFYPAVYINTNSNAVQRVFGEKVFWQTLSGLK
ncbi:SusD/RagB family nutrient-binding outer membrane lipoprotein [Microscilla marina]|uniref:Lipoprotein, putative n=1 Tax=Microscilla marina ATCC 23134 TaxID=313606 RepID=A1ZF03_MICM2|nr:SusD/RagB family nutrient-binding outer membrane lipoprotein [Microscilla marina]EAY31105.1 lipoprotein, putative [Microscilla marina ATCC 23134]